MIDVTVHCDGDASSGWSCEVTLDEDGRALSAHAVRVSAGDLRRLDPNALEPTTLVERSLAFLLEREPPSSILRSFDLSVIGRYFPEYESTIRSPGPRR
jgi:hypothetical protein